MDRFKIVSEYKMMGDQPKAVETLASGIMEGKKAQTLMGVTGSGKTFTMANIIEQVQSRLWSSATTRLWRLSFTASSRSSSLITQWNILSPTTITTSRRLTCRRQIPI